MFLLKMQKYFSGGGRISGLEMGNKLQEASSTLILISMP